MLVVAAMWRSGMPGRQSKLVRRLHAVQVVKHSTTFRGIRNTFYLATQIFLKRPIKKKRNTEIHIDSTHAYSKLTSHTYASQNSASAAQNPPFSLLFQNASLLAILLCSRRRRESSLIDNDQSGNTGTAQRRQNTRHQCTDGNSAHITAAAGTQLRQHTNLVAERSDVAEATERVGSDKTRARAKICEFRTR